MATKLRIEDVGYMEIDGVNMREYPDFAEAYASYAEYKDGTELTQEELDELSEHHHDYIHEYLFDNL